MTPSWSTPHLLRSFLLLVLHLGPGMGSVQAGIARQQPPTALDPHKTLTQYMHDVWQVEEGLPQNTVQAITQTREGYLWLGTEEGLVRFNGHHFTLFNRDTETAFGDNQSVTSLFEDQRGGLWIGTGSGLIVYRDEGFRRIEEVAGLHGQQIGSMVQDAGGRLWVGTLDAGLFVCDATPCDQFYAREEFLEAKISALQVDLAGVVWIGTDHGLYSVHSPTESPVKESSLGDVFVTELHAARDGSLWIGTRTGLFRLSGGQLDRNLTNEPGEENGIWSIGEDAAGTVWVGLSQDGVLRLQAQRVESMPKDHPLSRGRILAIFEDREGSLWIGTDGGGLHRLRDGYFTVLGEQEGLSSPIALTVFEDHAGSLWIGTEGGGLNRWREGAMLHYGPEKGLESEVVTSVSGTTDGDLWVGTLDNGLFRLQGDRFTRYGVDSGLPGEAIFALYHDRQRRLWVGTDQGIGLFDGKRFSPITQRQGLPSHFVTTFLDDGTGGMWIGTYDAGLVHYTNDLFSVAATPEQLGIDLVLALHQGPDGTLWIGTYGGGLAALRSGHVTRYTTREGLFDNVIYQILEDDIGNLWMGSNRGIFRVALSDLSALDKGEISRIEAISFSRDHGLRSHEVNGGSQPAGWKGRDGRLWFPTLHGVAAVDPLQLARAIAPPPAPRIERLLVDQVSHVPFDSLSLGPGVERIEIEFTALTFVAPEHVTYRYRLDGYDTDWSDAGTFRRATYTHLDPGTYTLRVIARNSIGAWHETGTSLVFTLKPHYYQTTLFWVALFLLVGAAGSWAYRTHLDRFKRQQRRLETAVNDRTRDLQAAKERIERQTDALQTSLREKEVLIREVHHRVKNNLQVITSLLGLPAQRVEDPAVLALFQECRDRIQAMALIHERLYHADHLAEVDLPLYLEDIVKDLARSYNAAYRGIEMTLSIEPVQLKIDQAIPVGLIVNELVSNAFKHAFPPGRSGCVDIAFSFNEGRYTLRVVDDGQGLPPGQDTAHPAGLGLKLVTALCRKLQGEMSTTTEGKLSFTLVFPAQEPET